MSSADILAFPHSEPFPPAQVLDLAVSVLLVLGVYTRYVALALVPILLGATWAHLGNGWSFSAPNGGWEYPAFWALALVVLFLLARFTVWGRQYWRITGDYFKGRSSIKVWIWLAVLLLSGYHGWMVGYARRLQAGERRLSGRTLRLVNEVPGLAAVIIVILAIIKPF